VLRLNNATQYICDVVFSGSDILSVVNTEYYTPLTCTTGETLSQAGIR
jgi:hypothetical protein